MARKLLQSDLLIRPVANGVASLWMGIFSMDITKPTTDDREMRQGYREAGGRLKGHVMPSEVKFKCPACGWEFNASKLILPGDGAPEHSVVAANRPMRCHGSLRSVFSTNGDLAGDKSDVRGTKT